MSANMTDNPQNYKDELSEISVTDAALSFLAACLAIFICTANALTITAIWRTPGLRTLANTYVCSLAVADFLVGLVCVLLMLFMLPPLRLEIFFKHINICALMQGMSIGMAGLSAMHMTLIAIDRYLYIIKPYVYQRIINIRVIGVFLGVAWVIGLVLALLPQFIIKPYEAVPLCDITDREPIWYTFYTCFTLYIVLCAINIIMYSIILRAADRQRRAVQMINVASTRQRTDNKRTGKSKNINKGTMKSIKFFITVFGVFFICGTPTVIILGLDYYKPVPSTLYRFLNLIALANSGMNFIIFAAMNKQFRHAFIVQTRPIFRCCHHLTCCSVCGVKDGPDSGGGGGGRSSDRVQTPNTMYTNASD